MLKRIMRSNWVRRFLGEAAALYLKFVWATNRVVFEPADYADRVDGELPVIVTMWHGQHFMIPFGRKPHWDMRVMISMSGDGEINAVAAKRLGMGLIRASGGRTGREIRKRGGIRGTLEMLRLLREGVTVSLTADVPKGPARVAGEGIVLIAERSGRPVLPVAFASSRRIDLDTWDKMSLNLPFGRGAFIVGACIAPPKDESERETFRLAVEEGLNKVTARAYAIVDGK
ncbi:lysophospholipid acyltransferase family protein [Pseudoxanthobacter sp.]|uniref:lysophospholipid acyltransferase family protein n=1 Tax=Pseudoxanthobacter sp. TaxID=1925742 RepID=UPI002FE33802